VIVAARLEQGLAGFVQKPYSLDLLRESLKDVLGGEGSETARF